MWGSCSSSMHSLGVILLCATVVGQSRWYLLYVAVFQSHCTWMLRYGDCPTAGRDLCEWASCTQMC